MTYKKETHPHIPGGFYLTFPSGRVWSCVKLTWWHDEMSEQAKIQFSKLLERQRAFGGEFEAMIVNPDGSDPKIDPDHQVRAASFEELFEKVEEYEKTL